MLPPLDPWARALLALRLLHVDPIGLGGLWLRARPGPARAAFTAQLASLPLPQKRIHPGIGDTELFGGLDLSATLAAGKLVSRAGLFETPTAFTLTMAERCPTGLAARLGQVLDSQGCALIAMDEGAEPDEQIPGALVDRLGLFVTLDDLPLAAVSDAISDDFAPARARLPKVALSGKIIADLTTTAAALGIASLRAPLLACAAARALAALNGHDQVQPGDVQRAVELIYAHRATQFPETEEQEPEQTEQEPNPPENDTDQTQSDQMDIPEEVLLEAALAALPKDLLAQLASGRATRASANSGTGAARKGNRRGRPLPSRPGRLDGRNRIDLVATLTAAAPWQPLRRKQAPHHQALHIRPSDIRVKRFQETSDRLLIFVVDASGSAAMARLAEAKGAVELLLAEAYARRDHVSLIAFRGEGADLMLPPTRSLVQTKRRLAGLPGGGGTPLAAGLRAALEVAVMARGKGMTPSIALLTDGRANIALDGTANRALAGEDAQQMARLLRAQGTPALVIDTGKRPADALRQLAQTLDAPYIPLPRADAKKLSSVVGAALEV